MNNSLKHQAPNNQSIQHPFTQTRSLRHQSIKVLVLAVSGLISLGNPPASATPVPNHQGDYIGSTTLGYKTWEVVDTDPHGLNCRMMQEVQPMILDAMDLPLALEQDYQQDIVNWNVVFSFKQGARLNAVIGNGRFNQIMRMDDRGRPWLGIRTGKGDCFVRANSRFVRPVGAPGWQ